MPGLWTMRTIAMMLRARLSLRLPPRLSRCLMVFPEVAGMGLTPPIAAKAASFLIRPGCDHATKAVAAVTGAIPVCCRRSAAAWPGRAR